MRDQTSRASLRRWRLLWATDLHGLERLLQHELTGWRVERTVDSVTNAMKAALADKTRTTEMGRQAQLAARQYDEPVFRQRWLELLASMCLTSR